MSEMRKYRKSKEMQEIGMVGSFVAGAIRV